MNEQPFADLSGALLRAGVATRHVRRAVLEIGKHFEDLVAQARSRGSDDANARREAWQLIGTQENIIRSYASRPELRAWSRRRPVLFFALLPLLAYATAGAACLFLLVMTADRNELYLKRLQLPAGITQGIDMAASIAFLWLLPWMISAAFAMLAHRRRAPLRWPIIAILFVSALASLCNVAVKIKGGTNAGEFGAGIGISLETLPQRLLHAALLALPALVLLRHAAARSLRD